MYPGGGLDPTGKMSKATFKFSISLSIAFRQCFSSFALSILKASSIVLGTSIPYLWVIHLTLEFIPAMILSCRRRVRDSHHAKAGWVEILLDIAYSATSSGLEYFNIFSGIHCFDLSYHSTSKSNPAVVCRICLLPLLVFMYVISFNSIAVLSAFYDIIS